MDLRDGLRGSLYLLRRASRRLNEAILASNQTIRHHHWVCDTGLDLAFSPSLAPEALT